MMNKNVFNPVAFISFPRSGRGITQKLLHEIYLHEITTGWDKKKRPDVWVDHDFKLNVKYDNRGIIATYRNPLHSFASWFDMNVDGGGRPDTRDAFVLACEREWIPYWNNWIKKYRETDCLLYSYEDFLKNPEKHLQMWENVLGVKGNITDALKKYPIKEQHDRSVWRYYDEEMLSWLSGKLTI